MDLHALHAQAQRAMDEGQWSRAGELLEQLSRHDKKNAKVLIAMGFCSLRIGRAEQARGYLVRAIKLSPMNPDAHVQLGLVEVADSNAHAAIDHFRRALMVSPAHGRATASLVHVLRKQGDYEEAGAIIDKSLARCRTPESHHAEALASVAARLGRHSEAMELLERVLAGSLSTPERAVLLYRKADLLDRAGRHLEAYDAVAEGARLRAVPWDMQAYETQLTEYFRAWTPAVFERVESSGLTTNQPVIVIGVPRSGTSLLEQIIASHPEAAGVGELPSVVTIATELQLQLGGSVSAFFTCPHLLRISHIGSGGTRYMDELLSLARKLGVDPSLKRIVDKLPHSYAHLPLIAKMLPRARIVHITRDPRDTAVSCYFQGFDGPMGYTFDLPTMARMIAHERRLVRHANEELGIPVHHVRYESLIAEPKRTIRALLDHLGLEFHEGCLSFHHTRRRVSTASTDQVRQPMYATSVGRWRRYEPRLGPLLQAFRAVGFDPDLDA